MRRGWSRRTFLESAVVAGVAAKSAPAAGRTRAAARPSPFRGQGAATLRAALDTLVPAEGVMPGASEAGALEYLEDVAHREPEMQRALQGALDALERTARAQGAQGFASLDAEARVSALAAFETREPGPFAVLRDAAYEGYYTRPEIWKRIGFEFPAPDRPGPGMGTFDEAALARLRALPPLYRPVR